jgi:hypothetical protein
MIPEYFSYRAEGRSPMELGLSIIRHLQQHARRRLKEQHGKIALSTAANEWFREADDRYADIGDWLAHWRLSMNQPVGELASHHSYEATAVHKFIDLCYALTRLSPSLGTHFSDDSGSIRLACHALLSDFRAIIWDSGVGYDLGLPACPQPTMIGKSEEYQQTVDTLRSIGLYAGNRSSKKKGRPKKVPPRTYPKECLIFHRVAQEAAAIAKRNATFRRGVYADWLKARSVANTYAKSCPEFQVGFVVNGQLEFSIKSKKLKKLQGN